MLVVWALSTFQGSSRVWYWRLWIIGQEKAENLATMYCPPWRQGACLLHCCASREHGLFPGQCSVKVGKMGRWEGSVYVRTWSMSICTGLKSKSLNSWGGMQCCLGRLIPLWKLRLYHYSCPQLCLNVSWSGVCLRYPENIMLADSSKKMKLLIHVIGSSHPRSINTTVECFSEMECIYI